MTHLHREDEMISLSREEIGKLYQMLDNVVVRGEVAKREIVDLMEKLVAMDKEMAKAELPKKASV